MNNWDQDYPNLHKGRVMYLYLWINIIVHNPIVINSSVSEYIIKQNYIIREV